MKLRVAQVIIVLPPEIDGTPGVAEDAVSEALSGNLEHKGAIVDWAYIPNPDGTFSRPFEIEVDDDYTEGDFLSVLYPKHFNFNGE